MESADGEVASELYTQEKTRAHTDADLFPIF